jgi:antibiotic biosynthesis monooxygenase (ABM) superfamily enzyme
MVTHIVLWKLLDSAGGRTKIENARIIKEKLESLVGVVPGLISARVGINPEGGEYDVALISEFTDMEALKAYDTHPEHLKVREFVKKVRKSRTSFDFEY